MDKMGPHLADLVDCLPDLVLGGPLDGPRFDLQIRGAMVISVAEHAHDFRAALAARPVGRHRALGVGVPERIVPTHRHQPPRALQGGQARTAVSSGTRRDGAEQFRRQLEAAEVFDQEAVPARRERSHAAQVLEVVVRKDDDEVKPQIGGQVLE